MRPYPTRDVYKARLESSHIFVAIYRESYGWVAPDMDISGIEDEFLIASKKGMDRLVYIHETSESRDPRLDALINSSKTAGITVSYYSDPEDLRARVRDDVTAIVTETFINQLPASDVSQTSQELIESLLPDPNHRLRRLEVENHIRDSLLNAGSLIITGSLGAGKTVLLAQLASENDWVFINGKGLNNLDLLAHLTNTLRVHQGQNPVIFPTELAVRQALAKSWVGFQGNTLVVDGAPDPELLWSLMSARNGLIISSRAQIAVPIENQLVIPPLQRDEIETWVTALSGNKPNPKEIATLFEQSQGNPLYLRFYSAGQTFTAELTLSDLEIRTFQALPARARELISYLSIARNSLSLSDLVQLIGQETDGPESIIESMSEASALIRQSNLSYELVHEHLTDTFLQQLHSDPARLAYFAARLGSYYEESGDFVAAYHVYDEAGETRSSDRILDEATNQVSFRGGGKAALKILKHKAEWAHELGRTREEVLARLTLAQALQQTGSNADAQQELANTREIVDQGEQDIRLTQIVNEIEVDVSP